MPVVLHRLYNRTQPKVVIQIAGLHTEHFQLEPLHPHDDYRQPSGQHGARAQAIDVRLTNAHRKEPQHESQPGDDLGAIVQCVQHHCSCHRQHQNQINQL